MTTKTVSSDVILEGHTNWDLWIFVVKRIAKAGDVWEYVNPDGSHQSPQKPEKPVRPMANMIYLIKDQPKLHDQLRMLRDLYSPTTADQEYRVQKAYESAKVFIPCHTNIEDWCNNFLTAYNRAKQLNLPEVHGFRAQKDLMRAINKLDTGYRSVTSLAVIEAEKVWNQNCAALIPDKTQLPTLLSNFLSHCRSVYSRKPNIHGGIFGTAMLNQERSPYSRKRLRDNKPAKLCICGDNHFWGQCPYIDTPL
ncbi:hypothetical protein EJ04DRAFT_412585, partial [Polyplosphaeria fusca]